MLAAGGSSRLGHPKQLVRHHGEPLVRRAAAAALAVGARPVVVVLGAGAAVIAPVLHGLAGVEVTLNPDWQRGVASSLAAGVRAVRAAGGCDGLLVLLADQPLVAAAALRPLIAAFAGGRRVVAAAYADVVGAPAVIGAERLDELLALEGDRGAGSWLRALGDAVAAVPLPVAAVDVDTPADLARLREAAAPPPAGPGPTG